MRCLSVEERVKVIIDFFVHQDVKISEDTDYKTWLRHQFGCYFSEHYPECYTRKYWATEAEKLSLSWIGNRIYRPSAEEVLSGAFPDAPEPENVYYGKVMRYPKAGGYKQFLSHIAENLDIRCNKNVCSIDVKRRKVHFSDGESCHYETLVSTLPLPVVAGMISEDEDVLRASEKLHTTSMALVSVGLRRKVEFPAIWFYVYDAEIPFARVHSPSMKSEDNAPAGKSSLQFEIYYSEEMPLKLSDEELVEKTLESMEVIGIAKKDDVGVADVRHVRYANIMYYIGMEEYRATVRDYLEGLGIITCGRFGEWKYLWSDQSFMSGYHAIV